MFPSEITILMAIDQDGGLSKTQLTCSMDIVGEYVGFLYDSLVKRGFIGGNKLSGHQLTAKGREAILKFLSEDETGTGQDKSVAILQLSIGAKHPAVLFPKTSNSSLPISVLE